MTDAEVKQAIERHGLLVWCSLLGQKWSAATLDMNHASFEKNTETEAVAEVVRQIEEKQE